MAVPLSALRDHAIFLSGLQERAINSADITPAQLSQFDFNDHSSLGPLVVAVSVVCMVLITPIVCLRLLVRHCSIGRFFLDDYLIILASVFTIVVCSVVIAATKYGLGKHIWNLDLDNILSDLKICIQLMFVANIFHAAAIAFTKMSIIASYMNIFAPRGLFRLVLQATGCITLGLGIASIPATIFECIPVSGAWSVTNRTAKCYTFVNFLYASTAINVATDLALCIVPIPFLWQLQLPRRQKMMISGLFFLGGFACIASIVRLAYLHLLEHPIDITRALVSSVIWTIAECTIGIVCVSLPHLRSLLAKILPGIFRSPHMSDKNGPGAPAVAAAAVAAMSAKSTDVMVLSSLTTRRLQHMLKSNSAPDVPAVPDVPDYKSRLATQFGMKSEMGVSVHITAGGHDDDSHSLTVANSTQGDAASRPPSAATHDVPQHTQGSLEMGRVPKSPKDPFSDA